MKYSSHSKNVSNSTVENKENSIPRKYNTLINSNKNPQKENGHSRYHTDLQIQTRALKSYSEFSNTSTKPKENVRYLDKTPKPTIYHNNKNDPKVYVSKYIIFTYFLNRVTQIGGEISR